MPRDPWTEHEPPSGGLAQLRRSIRERKRRAPVGRLALAAVATALGLASFGPWGPVEQPSASGGSSIPVSAHPALCVLGGARPAPVSLRGQGGQLTRVATSRPDVVLYVHQPED